MPSEYPTMSAWIVTTSPTALKTAGATTSVPYAIVSGLTVTANDRVTISVRTPQIPLVIALEEAL